MCETASFETDGGVASEEARQRLLQMCHTLLYQ
jgi:hypothetical protein